MYWLSSSAVLMGQIVLLKIPNVRRKLGIPPAVIHPVQASAEGQGGFLSTVKQSKLQCI